jgi:hypothetical protein
MEGTRNWNNRKVVHTHAQASMWTWRYNCVMEWSVCTDRDAITNRPGIIIKNSKEKLCIPIEVAILADRSVIQKEAENEINTRVYVQTYSECGTWYGDHTSSNWSHRNSNKRFKYKFEAIPAKHSVDSLQHTAVLEASHVIRKVLQSETWRISSGDHRWFKRGSSSISSSSSSSNNYNTLSFFLVIILLNQWCTPALSIQFLGWQHFP